ncbi:diguanylate cyclase [Pseudomonas putida]|uniref:Diguanylate cyclase n=1 Tax=Pseudomonas putida TaxID=303 RepID=A0A4D6X4M0_PSEPU|nr:diguanylate cyclase [Pseudomonas putida]
MGVAAVVVRGGLFAGKPAPTGPPPSSRAMEIL